jgi:HPt (histidine-containing phosphotransfer) domain-containing protein
VKLKELNHTLYSYTYLYKIASTNDQFIHKMINVFLNSMREYLAEFEQVLRTQKIPELKKVVHKLKPSVLNLEVQGAKPLIIALEEAKEWDQTVNNNVTALVAIFKKIIPYMEQDAKTIEDTYS